MYEIDEDEIAIVFTPEIVERMYHRICWILNEGILAGFSVFDQMKEFKARESLFKKVAKKHRRRQSGRNAGLLLYRVLQIALFQQRVFQRQKVEQKAV